MSAAAPPTISANVAWQGVSAKLFEECGMVFSNLCTNAAKNNTSVESILGPIRTWLDEAALRHPRASMAWGFLGNTVLEQHVPDVQSSEFEQDKKRTLAYLTAMEGVSTEAFSTPGVLVSTIEIHTTRRYWTRPVSHGLKRVLATLGSSRAPGAFTPMLQTLLAEGWDPKPLAVRLHALLPEQQAHLKDTYGHDGMVSETPYFTLMRTLCHSVAVSAWKPEDNHIFGPLWNYVGLGNETPEQLLGLYRELVHCMPTQIVHGLSTVVGRHNMLPQQVDAFFPLPLAKVEPCALLDSLVNILSMTRAADDGFEQDWERSQYFEQQLGRVHPELGALLSMHFELFPESVEDNTNVAVLLPAFEALVRNTMPPVPTLELPNLY